MRYRIAISTLAGMMLLSACAATQRTPSAEEEVVSRVQARWNHLLEGQIEDAYLYLSPAQRTRITSLDYQRQVLGSKIMYRSADVLDATCEENTCTARVTLGMVIISPVPGVKQYEIARDVSEQWVLAENQWWFVPQ